MIRLTTTAPQPSYTTDPGRHAYGTGFDYVAHVPPKAIGPQIAGSVGQYTGQRSVLLPALGAAVCTAAPLFVRSKSRAVNFGLIGGSVGFAGMAAHNYAMNRSISGQMMPRASEVILTFGAPVAMLGLWTALAKRK